MSKNQRNNVNRKRRRSSKKQQRPYWLLIPVVLILGGVILLAATSSNSGDSLARNNPEIFALGKQVYETSCASCHGINGEGQRPDLGRGERDETGRFPAPPHTGDGHTWHHDDNTLISIINNGGSGDDAFYEMPAFGDTLSDEQVEAVLAYIKTFWTAEQRQRQQASTNAANNGA